MRANRLFLHFPTITAIVTAAVLFPTIAQAQTGKKRNILVIWGDDIGQFMLPCTRTIQ